METARYILLVAFCISLFYAAYRLVFKKETNFPMLRTYLLGSVFLSLILPLITLKIETGLTFTPSQLQNTHAYTVASEGQSEAFQQQQKTHDLPAMISSLLSRQNLLFISIYLYLSGVAFMLIRLLSQITLLTIAFGRSKKVRHSNYILLFNHGFKHTFSCFRWIFVDSESASSNELRQIIAHENIHVSQHHSFDNTLMELLTTVMWFNPLIWKMKQEIQLVHEYLADEGVLNTGVDRLVYQALLINQVAEERLISLSSNFNYSLIKKRIAMMTTSKINKNTRVKLLTLIPLSAALFFIIAITNGTLASKPAVHQNLIQPSPDHALKSGLALPVEETADTIKKKIIVKMVSSKNPNDTIVEESEEIVVTNDSLGRKYVTVSEHGSKVHHYETCTDTEKSVHKKTVIITADEKENQSTTENDKSGSEVKTIVIKKSGNKNPNILYIIDGVEQSDNDALLKTDPDEIQSIEVVRDDHAKKYTEKEVDGVIIISTKSGKKTKE